MSSLVRTGPRPIGPELGVGPIGFGCWRFVAMSTTDARERLELALDAGMNLVDTADVYGLDWGGDGFGAAESLLGSVLADAPELRARMVLATKGGISLGVPYDSREEHLVAAADASLSRLGVDSVDLYQIHRPDLFAHPDEVAAGLETLRKSGKTREVGVSNYTRVQLETIAAALPFPLASTQPEFSALDLTALRDGHLDVAMRLDLAVLAWSPLAGGRLATGEDVRPELREAIDLLAERESVDRATIALAFVLAHPSAPVALLGSMNPDRIRSAARALKVQLDRSDVYSIVQASEGVPLP